MVVSTDHSELPQAYYQQNEAHYHKKCFALNLVLKVRVFRNQEMAFLAPFSFYSSLKDRLKECKKVSSWEQVINIVHNQTPKIFQNTHIAMNKLQGQPKPHYVSKN